MTGIRLFDNTRLSAHRTCSRKYYYRHVRHLSGSGVSPTLTFGSAWHSAMDYVWSEAAKGGRPEDVYHGAFEAFSTSFDHEIGKPWVFLSEETVADFKKKNRTPEIAHKMLFSYCAKRVLQIQRNFELLSIEQPFIVPTTIDNVLYVGRLDKLFRWVSSDGMVWNLDHKTTGDGSGKSGFYSSWSEQWNPNSQVEGYIFAGKMLYKDFKGVVIDGALVNNAAQHEEFVTIDHADDVLDTWMFDLEAEVQAILLNEQRLASVAPHDHIMAAFPRNTNACMDFKVPCTYLSLCRGIANPHAFSDEQFTRDERLIIRPWSPFSEIPLEKLGLSREGTGETS